MSRRWHLWWAVCAMAIASSAHGWTQITASPVTVVAVGVRSAGFTASADAQYFLFNVSASFVYSCSPTPTAWVAIPKLTPNTNGSNGPAENPAYRDYVNTVTLAYTLGAPLYVYVDGCLDNSPRVVGITMLPV